MKKQEPIPEKLRAAGKKLPFTVPDSYFDELPGRIQEKLILSGKPKSHGKFPAFSPKLAMAAMFIGLIAVGYAGFRVLSDRGNSAYLRGEELGEAIEYLAYDLDEDILLTTILESDLPLSSQSANTRTEDIIQYLSEEDINFNDLIDEY